MAVLLNNPEHLAIATQLAQMNALQRLLILNEQELIDAVDDSNIRQQLQNMLEQDQKHLGILDTVMTQYGVQGELRNAKQDFEGLHSLMNGSELTLAEKVLQHELPRTA